MDVRPGSMEDRGPVGQRELYLSLREKGPAPVAWVCHVFVRSSYEEVTAVSFVCCVEDDEVAPAEVVNSYKDRRDPIFSSPTEKLKNRPYRKASRRISRGATSEDDSRLEMPF